MGFSSPEVNVQFAAVWALVSLSLRGETLGAIPWNPVMRRLVIAHRFFAVFADRLKALSVGAPLEPGFRILSPDPALIRRRLAWMLSYSPFLAIQQFQALSDLLMRLFGSLAVLLDVFFFFMPFIRAQKDFLRALSFSVFGLGAGFFSPSLPLDLAFLL